MTDRQAFIDSLREVDASVDVDALVHLAWARANRSNWNEDHEANVQTTANAFDAALDGGVDRVVVASSAHVVGMYSRDDVADIESTVADPTDTVDTESAVRPIRSTATRKPPLRDWPSILPSGTTSRFWLFELGG